MGSRPATVVWASGGGGDRVAFTLGVPGDDDGKAAATACLQHEYCCFLPNAVSTVRSAGLSQNQLFVTTYTCGT